MTLPLFFCGELDSVLPSDSSVVEVTTSGHFDPAFSRCAIQVPSGRTATPNAFTPVTGMWVHYELLFNELGDNDTGGSLIVKNSSGTVVAKVVVATINLSSFLQLFILTGSGLVQVGNNVGFTENVLQQVDIELNAATGAANIYVAAVKQSAATVSFAAITNMASVQFGNGRLENMFYSQMIGHTLATVSMRLQTVAEDTDGPNQDWTGAVTDINELPLNDATGITAATAGLVATYNKASLSLTGTILSFGVSCRFDCGLTGPQNIQNVLNVGGTVFTGPTVAGC